MTPKFLTPWEKLEVSYDGWAATTEQSHKDCVSKILQRLWDEKDPATGQSRWIYKDSRSGYYSVRQEQFLTEKERGPDGEFGEEWGQVEFREEENYYFRLTGHKQWLLDLIDSRSAAGSPLVTPDFRVAELRNAVEKIDGDLCISRPVERLSWGIPFPFDPGFVTYVWFDALVNYISFVPGYDPLATEFTGDFRKWWPAVHVIGKDILIPAHGVYWPIMLKALGFADADIPSLLVHGWLNIGGAKMSKSLGNVVDPSILADKYGPEAVRYYLVSDISTGRDSDFSEERLVQRFNTDLANRTGNLLNRSLNMAQKYREGRLTKSAGLNGAAELAETTLAEYTQAFETYRVDEALESVFRFADFCNGLVETEKPWALAKDPTQAARLDEVLYTLAESLRIIAILLSPVLPKAAAGIVAQLNWNGPLTLANAGWGGLADGHVLGSPVPLFLVSRCRRKIRQPDKSLKKFSS